MSLKRLINRPIRKGLSLVLSPVKKRFYLHDRKRLWLNHPELGLAFFYDYRQCSNMGDYRKLLSTLANIPNSHCQTLEGFLQPQQPDKLTFALRHDIDNDICAALQQARIEHEFGLKGSYYVLHTADYYGFRHNNDFQRSVKCLDILLEIQSLGHEIGLHNDCLNNLLTLGIPVSETLSAELGHLRSAGLAIAGTVSHGSYHTYLASNYEIFEGLSINGRGHFTDRNGITYSLNALKMSDYGLCYEGNHIIRSFMVSKEFYDRVHQGKFTCPAAESDWFERDYEAQYGIFGKDYWLGTNEQEADVSILTESEAVSRMLGHQPGSRIVIDSHPEYYGHNRFRQWLHSIRKHVL